ncbi:hypothetical protein BZG36_03586 [Bifiguratus adelaidae]|uniref:BZIP domain-containing protein n=1 Tax=Bifiguratus adelaidae TaxID=1938954 RepID=A0A261XYI0_9FUNG|nr:hypothetical protein BZG36_03586 [Bifiguratus adelaidae]
MQGDIESRKAQNREAQRAFRQRRLQHMKTLERDNVELTKNLEQVRAEYARVVHQLEKTQFELETVKAMVGVMQHGGLGQLRQMHVPMVTPPTSEFSVDTAIFIPQTKEHWMEEDLTSLVV